jgi:hypothetical protein
VRAIYDCDDCLPERVALMRFWADKIDVARRQGTEERQLAGCDLIRALSAYISAP